MKALPASKRRWNTKHGSENCGVGQTLFIWKLQKENICPCCDAMEDTSHGLQCTAFKSQPTWDSNIEALTNVLINYDLPIILQTALHSCLTSWQAKVPFLIDPLWPPDLATLMLSQETLGWKNFLEGVPSTLWIPYIESHLDTSDYAICPRKGLTKILLAGHHLAWSQWECRNHYLHEEGTPREIQAMALLDQQVTLEFLTGPTDLSPQDHHHFAFSLSILLSRSKSYKQHWYMNVLAARQCQDRRVAATGTERTVTVPHSRLTHWMQTGRLQ
jgi:hypothetical protein